MDSNYPCRLVFTHVRNDQWEPVYGKRAGTEGAKRARVGLHIPLHGEQGCTRQQEVDMAAFTVFGAPEWLSVIIVVGIVAATIYFVRRAI